MANYIQELQDVIRRLHGADATHVESVPVKEIFQGKTVWEGIVEVFDLHGHPKAWSVPRSKSGLSVLASAKCHVSVTGCTQGENGAGRPTMRADGPNGRGVPMSTEQNKAAARRITEEAWNKGNLGILEEYVSPGAVHHDPNNPIAPGPQGLKQLISMYRSAFPDLHFAIEQEIADGDYVVERVVATGTQRGDLPALPATGKRASVTAIVINRFKDGKIVEDWAISDQLGLLQQLGVVPTAEQMAAKR